MDKETQNNITFTSVFTPTADTTDSSNVLTLSGNYTDTLGNAGPTGATTANYEVDTDLPAMTAVTIASSTSNPTNAATLATTGQTVTLSIDADEDIAQPTVVFTSGGAAAGSVTYTNSGDNDASTWTATYTVAGSHTDGTVAFELDFADLAGNSGTQVTAVTDNSSVTVDQTAITLSALTIVSDNANTALATTGDVVTLTINATEDYTTAPTVVFTGATNADVVAVNQTDASIYTATYTVAANDTNGVLAFTVTSTDASGNESTNTSTTNSSAVTIDTAGPSVSSSNISDTSLKANETAILTITFNEAVTGFTSADVSPANGTGSLGDATTDNNITYAMEFTPAANNTSTDNSFTLANMSSKKRKNAQTS